MVHLPKFILLFFFYLPVFVVYFEEKKELFFLFVEDYCCFFPVFCNGKNLFCRSFLRFTVILNLVHYMKKNFRVSKFFLLLDGTGNKRCVTFRFWIPSSNCNGGYRREKGRQNNLGLTFSDNFLHWNASFIFVLQILMHYRLQKFLPNFYSAVFNQQQS